MAQSKSNIAILGAGSVGLATAATLVEAGAQITLLARGEAVMRLRAEGIKVTGVLGEHAILPGDFSVADVSGPAQTECDLLVVTTKTYEVAPALRAVLPKINPLAILLMQNGWGTAQDAKEIVLPLTPVFSASVMVGYERRSPTQVHIHAYGDKTRVGSLFGDDDRSLRPLLDLPKPGFIPFVYEPNIEPALLTKLLYNICLNPLGALRRCSYGDLMRNEETLGIMCRIADEGIRVLKAARGFTGFASGDVYVRGELVPKWLGKVGAHRSSMLQDLESGRQTEIAYLNGAICTMGRQFNIETPDNDAIVQQIQAAEKPG